MGWIGGDRHLATLVLAALSSLSCGESSDPSPAGFQIRDSAGIEIVENHPAAWPPPEVWRIAGTPRVDIGVVAGDPHYELFQTRGAVRLEDGRIVVGEWDARVRFYDSTGLHLETLDLRGEGPGEVPFLADLLRYRGDSLLIFSEEWRGNTEGRATLILLDRDGRFARNIDARLPGTGSPDDTSILVGRGNQISPEPLADGSLLVESAGRLTWKGAVGSTIWSHAPLLRVGMEGRFVDTVSVLQVLEFEHQPLGADKYGWFIDGARAPAGRTHGMLLHWTRGDRYRVEVFEIEPIPPAAPAPAPSARRIKSIRISAPRQATTEAFREAWIRANVTIYSAPETGGQDTAEIRGWFDGVTLRDTIPAIQALMVDALGNVWLERYQIPGSLHRDRARRFGVSVETERPTWIVLDPQGRLLGSVRTPVGLEITEIGSDHILGMWSDELGVKHVRMFDIEKGR